MYVHAQLTRGPNRLSPGTKYKRSKIVVTISAIALSLGCLGTQLLWFAAQSSIESPGTLDVEGRAWIDHRTYLDWLANEVFLPFIWPGNHPQKSASKSEWDCKRVVGGGGTSKSGGGTGKALHVIPFFFPVLQSHTSAPIFGNVIMPSTPTPPTFTLQLFLDSPFVGTDKSDDLDHFAK